LRRFINFPGLLLVAAYLALNAPLVSAQDSHYWDNQYGTRSELLGGLVVGSPTDLSSTFYNPGWISLQEQTSVLLTTKAVESYEISSKEGIKINANPASSGITTSPGYLAGRFSVGKGDGWKWAYSYLQKVKFDYFSSAINIETNPSPAPGENLSSANETFRVLATGESWYGFSFSRKLADNIGIGFSPFGVYRDGRSRSQLTSNNLRENLNHADASLLSEYSYWNFRMLMKIGLAIEGENWTAGLTLTTPSLHVVGVGEVQQKVSLTGDYNPDNPGEDPPFLSADHQPELDSKWKSPFSVAAGTAYTFGESRLYFSGEWFAHVPNYDIITPESYAVQSAPQLIVDYRLSNAAQSVFNYGLGLEHTLTKKTSLYGSYRTDYTSAPKGNSTELSITNWDLKHISAGASFDFFKIEFTLGLQYSWGGGVSEPIAIDLLKDTGQLSDAFSAVEYDYRRLKALIGFNLPFGRVEGDL
jgi:hypothetical protein